MELENLWSALVIFARTHKNPCTKVLGGVPVTSLYREPFLGPDVKKSKEKDF